MFQIIIIIGISYVYSNGYLHIIHHSIADRNETNRIESRKTKRDWHNNRHLNNFLISNDVCVYTYVYTEEEKSEWNAAFITFWETNKQATTTTTIKLTGNILISGVNVVTFYLLSHSFIKTRIVLCVCVFDFFWR